MGTDVSLPSGGDLKRVAIPPPSVEESLDAEDAVKEDDPGRPAREVRVLVGPRDHPHVLRSMDDVVV